MSIQVSKIQGGNQSMHGPGNVRIGNQANASHFGADRYQDISNLAKAGLRASTSMLDEVQKRQHEEAQTKASGENTQARLGYLEKSKGIFSRKGRDAEFAPDEMNKLLESMKKEHIKSLGDNKLATQMFEQMWSKLEEEANADAILHRNQQMDWYAKEELKAKNAGMCIEASAKVIKPDGIKGVLKSPYVEMIGLNVDKLYQGAPPETIEQAKAKQIKTFHMEQMKSLWGSGGPNKALEYLKDERVSGIFSAAEGRVLREQYEKDSQNAEALAAGRDFAVKGLKGKALLDAAYERFKDHPEQYSQSINYAKQYEAEDEQATIDANKQFADSALSDLAKNNYAIDSVPEDIRLNKPKVYQALVNYADFMKQHGRPPVVDMEMWNSLMEMKPETLRTMMQEEDWALEARLSLGPWWADVENRMRMRPQEVRLGPGTFGFGDVEKADIDYAMNAYREEHKKRTGKTLDDKNEDEKARQGQYAQRVREAFVAAMDAKGGKLSMYDVKSITFGLLQNYKGDEEGTILKSRKDVQAFEILSDPEKHQVLAVTDKDNNIVRGEFGTDLLTDRRTGRTFENISATHAGLADTIRKAAVAAEREDGKLRHDVDEDMFAVSFKNRIEVYDRDGELLDTLETAPLDQPQAQPEAPQFTPTTILEVPFRDVTEWDYERGAWRVTFRNHDNTHYYDEMGGLIEIEKGHSKFNHPY